MVDKKFKFSKANRLQTPAEYKAVFNQPIRSRSAYFTILARPNQSEYARLGVIAAKRIIRLSVRRNLIRRWVRESFRLNQELIAGLDVVVLVRCVLPNLPAQKFYSCLNQQWTALREQWQKGL